MEFPLMVRTHPPPLMENKTWSKNAFNHLKQTLKSTCFFAIIWPPPPILVFPPPCLPSRGTPNQLNMFLIVELKIKDWKTENFFCPWGELNFFAKVGDRLWWVNKSWSPLRQFKILNFDFWYFWPTQLWNPDKLPPLFGTLWSRKYG